MALAAAPENCSGLIKSPEALREHLPQAGGVDEALGWGGPRHQTLACLFCYASSLPRIRRQAEVIDVWFRVSLRNLGSQRPEQGIDICRDTVRNC